MPRKILLIDRDPVRRSQMHNVLASEQFHVAGCETGKDALNHLLLSSVAAVVLDYGSAYGPEDSVPEGRRVVQEIMRVDAFVPLIVVCDPAEILEPETVGAADLVLGRPVTERELVNGVNTVLRETLRERAQRKSGYIFAFR